MSISLNNKQYLSPSTIFFGQYLINHNVVDAAQLDEAVQFQHSHNRLLGQLAVEKGYMTQSQVDRTRIEQKNLDLPFGVIAVRKGYLGPDQLDDLLFSQIVNTTHVGEALVELGHLPPEELGFFLRKYNQEQEQRLQNIEDVLEKADARVFPVRAGIHALDRAFIRFVHEPVNIVSVDEKPGSYDRQWSFFIRIEMSSGRHQCIIVNLSESSALKVAGKAAQKYDSQKCSLRCLGRNLLFFTIVKRYFAANLLDHDYPVVRTRMFRNKDADDVKEERVRVSLSSAAGEFEAVFFSESNNLNSIV